MTNEIDYNQVTAAYAQHRHVHPEVLSSLLGHVFVIILPHSIASAEKDRWEKINQH